MFVSLQALSSCVVVVSMCSIASATDPQHEQSNVWKPICWGAHEDVDLDAMARRHAHAFARATSIQHITTRHNPIDGAGVTITFNVTGTPPAGALDALQSAADLVGALFDDQIAIAYDINFEPLGSVNGEPILGGAGNSYSGRTYAQFRDALVASMDADDTIEDDLPTGTTIDVLYGLDPSTQVSARSSLLIGSPQLQVLFGQSAGNPPITFSSNAPFDFDPSDGITPGTYCFTSVVIHEIIHTFGFGSNVDFLHGATLLPMDVYRFRESDGPNTNLNPDTLGDFATVPRTVYLDNPNNPVTDEAILDFIDVEIPMSDGAPWQGSHYRELPSPVGIMDPRILPGETYYPAYVNALDLRVLDALGWTYVDIGCYADCDQSGTINIFDYICFGNAYANQDPYADCDQSGMLNVFDYICFGNAYAGGCP
ncbi:MAG: hypothetical protein H6815_04865 [Phycisphaeraceae bacterium]|nr:NF038122 family metalloprotease [Phycisphaerales bacterium]MCB9859766.1 hypothetical protein [Phycisphaeraceae bacterium]